MNTEMPVESVAMFSRMFLGNMIFVVTGFYLRKFSSDKFQHQFNTFDKATDFIREICENRMPTDCVSVI